MYRRSKCFTPFRNRYHNRKLKERNLSRVFESCVTRDTGKGCTLGLNTENIQTLGRLIFRRMILIAVSDQIEIERTTHN